MENKNLRSPQVDKRRARPSPTPIIIGAIATFVLVAVLLSVVWFASTPPKPTPQHLVPSKKQDNALFTTLTSPSVIYTLLSTHKVAVGITVFIVVALLVTVLVLTLAKPKEEPVVVEQEEFVDMVKSPSRWKWWIWAAIMSVILFVVVILYRLTCGGGEKPAEPKPNPNPAKPADGPKPDIGVPYVVLNYPDDTNVSSVRFDDDDSACHKAIDAAARLVMNDFNTIKAQGNPLNNTLFIVNYDLMRLPVDAICNAANTRCLGGDGVDKAVHSGFIGGLKDKLLRNYIEDNLAVVVSGTDCRCPTGSARLLVALPQDSRVPEMAKEIKVILQSVGPAGGSTIEREFKLRQVYWNILEKCRQYGIRHVTIPPISTGIFGTNEEEKMMTAEWVLDTVKRWMRMNPDSRLKIVLTLFDGKLRTRYLQLARQHFAQPIDDRPVK